MWNELLVEKKKKDKEKNVLLEKPNCDTRLLDLQSKEKVAVALIARLRITVTDG